jgi:translation initiation factor 4A
MVLSEFDNWSDIEDIKQNLLRGIYAYGFESPSPIQKKAILPTLSGKDTIAQAQSGTGKTGAFSVSILQSIDETKNETQAVVMAPTRELAMQIYEVMTSLGSFIKELKIKLLIGGVSVDHDFESLRTKHHIIIGCPGRIHDMMKRQKINTNTIKMMVIDEADEMLSAGFKDQVYNIFQFLNNDIQVVLYSATLPEEIQTLTSKFMRDPVKILVKTEAITLEGISQYYVALDDDQQKYETLKDIFEKISVNQTIIYCNSIKRVSDLTDALLKDNFPVCCIHSNMTKQERERAYNDFKSGNSRVLISSNLTARGIDVQQVSIVINFDIPKDIHTYIHRIGRSGRWGRKGTGINFITRRDIRKMKEIEQYYQTEINELPGSFVTEQQQQV